MTDKAHDPFAVSSYDVATLPEVPPSIALPDFELWRYRRCPVGFAEAWVRDLGGPTRAARTVLNAVEPGKHGIVDPSALGPMQPGAVINLTPGNLAAMLRLEQSTQEQELSQRLAVLALLEFVRRYGGHEATPRGRYIVPKDLLRALAIVLRVDGKLDRRNAAAKRALARARRMRAKDGPTATSVVDEVSAKAGVSRAQLWKESAYPIYGETMKRGAVPHASAPWFVAGIEDRVAVAIGQALATEDLRWDLFNLVEGFSLNRRPISDATLHATYIALGLGKGGGHLTLGGVIERRKFMDYAREVNGEDDFDKGWTAMSTDRRWAEMSVFRTACAMLKKS